MRGEAGRRLGKGGGSGSLGGKFIACRICGQPTRYRDSVGSPIRDQVHCGADACRAASKALRYSKTSATRLAAIASGTVPVMRDNWRLASQVAKEEDAIGPWMENYGWTPQYKVLTGVHSIYEPRYYKLDFAHCGLRLCVEIDGASHRFAARKARDDQKDQFLRGQGWKVLRLSAAAVGKDISGALIAIAEFMRAGNQSTKL
jgi:hypothetical protein